MKLHKWSAPLCSYYYMSEPGVTVSVTPPNDTTPKDFEADILKVQNAVEALENRLDTASDEVKEWLTNQISSLKETLETIQVNSQNSVEGLLQQVTSLKSQVEDILTRPQPVALPEPETVEPPIVPAPPASGGDTPAGAPAPNAPASPPKPKKRVL